MLWRANTPYGSGGFRYELLALHMFRHYYKDYPESGCFHAKPSNVNAVNIHDARYELDRAMTLGSWVRCWPHSGRSGAVLHRDNI